MVRTRMLVDLILVARPSKLPAAPPALQSLLVGVSSTGNEVLCEVEHLRARAPYPDMRLYPRSRGDQMSL